MKTFPQLLGAASALFANETTVLGQKVFDVPQLEQISAIPGLPTPAQLVSELGIGLNSLDRRVPLSTNDNTSIPLVDLQILHPPPVPKTGTHCTVELLKYAFGNSYDAPAVVSYSPPTSKECGNVGNWGAVVGNLTVYSNGTQYDRLSSLYLDHVEIWRHSSAEPTKTGTVWTSLKDLTPYTALLSKNGTLLMDFSNIISTDLGLDGVFYVTLTATFHSDALKAPSNTKSPSEVIMPLSNLSPNHSNYFTISDSAMGGVSNVTIPSNAVSAVVEVYCSGNSAEEFWYLNTPDEIASYFSPDAGLVAKGPFREVQVLVDGKLAGVVLPFPVIYTGGITPTNWRPLASYGAYNQPTYFVDITPFLPTLTDSAPHNITFGVLGQGLSPPHSINSNWFVSGNVRLTLGASQTRTTGKITSYSVDPYVDPSVKSSASSGNVTVHASIAAQRKIRIASELVVGGKEKRTVVFEQNLKFENVQDYADDGLVQWGTQSTTGYTKSSINGQTSLLDTFSYPLSVFSNYTLYSMQFGAYGSAINQTFTRAIQPPSGVAHTIFWTSRAQGWVGMDDAPRLRHAINGTGETVQAFAYGDLEGETYLRKSHAKNDGWVSDKVWGTLASANPPVKDTNPNGGSGFRRRELETRFPRGN
ncbi:peptide-N4-(N-acetyl-beta-glucosaminyl)asparagine amidase A [Rhizoctonia solani AG-3 Rhs1AP]|uniref:Peptide-N4-(N-acetyl-beta-glucosaminyl)asparagine amidase A n=1 Tax=Rhizoctonia solani AG-3 Rhs1AP TaxID=1086054 RepID=X8JG84_9AGAM|nr:peptide-N4-(N-acetyl-beta-glucosaminyl)asparagine amidase A [Rhizoctonia solani AG-3 Rhs1AP]